MQTQEMNAPRRYLVADGVRLAYTDAGSGPPVICLHAIGHDAADFADVQRRFADRYRVIALDWPGHGGSAADSTPASATRYTHVLAAAIDALDLDRVTLLGNSIGGAAALEYAAAHPDRVRGLLLENPGGLDPGTDRIGRTALAALAAFFGAGERGAWWYPTAYGLYYRMVLPRRAAAARRAQIVAMGRAMAPILHAAWRSFARPEADLRRLLPSVRCPVQFAWAIRDRLIQLPRCEAAIRLLPNARLERFPAGHAPHLETPEEFSALFSRFVAELP